MKYWNLSWFSLEITITNSEWLRFLYDFNSPINFIMNNMWEYKKYIHLIMDITNYSKKLWKIWVHLSFAIVQNMKITSGENKCLGKLMTRHIFLPCVVPNFWQIDLVQIEFPCVFENWPLSRKMKLMYFLASL